jgi:hypothetical protein
MRTGDGALWVIALSTWGVPMALLVLLQQFADDTRQPEDGAAAPLTRYGYPAWRETLRYEWYVD